MTNWIEWNGGECPIKSDKTRVECKFKNGYVGNDLGCRLRWTCESNSCDIIAYRIIEDHEPKMTREQIMMQIAALQVQLDAFHKKLDALPSVRRIWYSEKGFSLRGPIDKDTYIFDIETINGVPHIHGIAMKEVTK